jgi:predicted nuclease with RNAse H fold
MAKAGAVDVPRAAFGIDVSAEAVFVAGLDLASPPSVVLGAIVHPFDAGTLARLLRGAAAVAIDAPAGLSSRPHLGDRRLPPKFQRARCGEVALRGAGHSVPWVSPAEGDTLPSWMARGFDVWSVACGLGVPVVETFPHAVFATLAGSVLLHKQRPGGALARAGALAPLLATPAWLALWSHDGLDALAAAVVARQVAFRTARRVGCSPDDRWATHDGSAIWLPAAGEGDAAAGGG